MLGCQLVHVVDEVRQIVETWRGVYKKSWPPRALGERTPNEFPNEIVASRNLFGL
jgi:hypothetical protein